MNMLHRLEYWGEHHHPRWLDFVRIALGILLCFKGIEFARNMGTVMGMLTNSVPFSSLVLVLVGHYVVFAHILGGFMLAIGLLTRFACLLQIPILLGAIVFINYSPEMLKHFSELYLSIIVFILLVYFLISGGGSWSFDAMIDKDGQAK